MQFVQIEPRVVAEDLRQVKKLHYFLDWHLFAIAFRRPPEQAEIIHHSFRRVAFVNVGHQRSALIALAHLGAVDVENQRNMRVFGRFNAECLNSAICLAVLLKWSSPRITWVMPISKSSITFTKWNTGWPSERTMTKSGS